MYFTASIVLAYIAAISNAIPVAIAPNALNGLGARAVQDKYKTYYVVYSTPPSQPAATDETLEARAVQDKYKSYYVTYSKPPSQPAAVDATLQARKVHDEHRPSSPSA